MSEMNPLRFRALLDAYGAAPDRWPEGEREAALGLLRNDRQAVADYEDEGAFDDLLATSRSPAPSQALTHRILAGAPVRHIRKRLLTWWTGLALATAGAAGVLCGTTAAAAFEPTAALPSYAHGATAFGSIGEESDPS